MLAGGEEEGRVAGGLLGGIVVGELSGVQELVPIVLAVVDEAAQHLLGSAVGALGLALGLGVVGGGHFQPVALKKAVQKWEVKSASRSETMSVG